MQTAASLDIGRKIFEDVCLRTPDDSGLAGQISLYNHFDSLWTYIQNKDIGPLGLAQQFYDGNDAAEASFTSQYLLTLTPGNVGLKHSLTFVADQTEQYPIYKRTAEQLKSSVLHARAYYAASGFGNGFSALGADGVAWFSASHPSKGGGPTYSNLGTAAVFSYLSMSALHTTLRNQTDAAGKKMVSTGPVQLCVPPALEDPAMRLLGTKQVIGSNNNDINAVIQMRGYELQVLDYLTSFSTTMYFMVLKDKKRTSLDWVDQIPVTTNVWEGPMKQKVCTIQNSYAAGTRGGYGFAGNAGA